MLPFEALDASAAVVSTEISPVRAAGRAISKSTGLANAFCISKGALMYRLSVEHTRVDISDTNRLVRVSIDGSSEL
jgi:hypothetical protein